MLFFHADWCTSCIETERFVFTDPRVRAAMARFALIEADVTENNANDTALLKRFGLFGPPAILFFDAQGNPVEQVKVVGYQPVDRFLVSLDRAAPATATVKTSSIAPAASQSTDVTAVLNQAILQHRTQPRRYAGENGPLAPAASQSVE